MTSSQLLLEGLELMLIGTGLVFIFLVLLIGCIRLMSLLLQRTTVQDSVPVLATATVACPLPDADTLAAIQAAVHQHRNRHA